MHETTLEKLLEKSAKDPAYRPDFYAELMISDFIAVHQPENPAAPQPSGPATQDTPVSIKHMKKETGEALIPVFTSVEAMQRFIQTEEQYLKANARVLFNMFPGAFYVLNPGSDYGKEFTPEEITRLLSDDFQKNKTFRIEAGTNMTVGEPAERPHALTYALKNFFSGVQAVQAAYLAQVFIPGQDASPHLMISIDMPEKNKQVFQGAASASERFIQKGDYIDFVLLKESAELIKGIEPFYKKR